MWMFGRILGLKLFRKPIRRQARRMLPADVDLLKFEPGQGLESEQAHLIDSHGRVLRDLRISVTDKCNFRCLYCLPETEAAANFYQSRFSSKAPETAIVRKWHPRSELLTFEE